MSQEFALYIDESGSPKPNRSDQASYFALGGYSLNMKMKILFAREFLSSRNVGASIKIFLYTEVRLGAERRILPGLRSMTKIRKIDFTRIWRI